MRETSQTRSSHLLRPFSWWTCQNTQSSLLWSCFCKFMLDGPPKDSVTSVSFELPFGFVFPCPRFSLIIFVLGTLVTCSARAYVPVYLGPRCLGGAGSKIDFINLVCSSWFWICSRVWIVSLKADGTRLFQSARETLWMAFSDMSTWEDFRYRLIICPWTCTVKIVHPYACRKQRRCGLQSQATGRCTSWHWESSSRVQNLLVRFCM